MAKPQITLRSGLGNHAFLNVNLGDRARDTITGFQGIVIARSEFLTGCNQICLSPLAAQDGSIRNPEWFDVERVEVTEVDVVTIRHQKTGADVPPPPARRPATGFGGMK